MFVVILVFWHSQDVAFPTITPWMRRRRCENETFGFPHEKKKVKGGKKIKLITGRRQGGKTFVMTTNRRESNCC